MTQSRSLAVACIALGLTACALTPHRALAQGGNDPLATVPKLLQELNKEGFEALQGRFRILDPVTMACSGVIPTTWYNNVQPYMSVILPAKFDDPNPSIRWEKTKRALPVNYLLRQDEAILIVGSTPPPMAYYSFQTLLFGRYNPATYGWDPATGGFFRPYELPVAYVGDTVNSSTIRTTGSTPYNRPMALISTGNRRTQEHLRSALRAAGYADAAINTETLPPSLVRFGYENADQFLFTMRMALAAGGNQAIDEFEKSIEAGNVMRIFRVRPTVEFPSDPLPAPVLRARGTGQTEMDLYPTMEKLRQAILTRHATAFNPEELDTFLPDSVPEGYPALQRGIAYRGPGQDGSAGYGRDANYWASPWFDLPADAFAIVYGVDHAATGKATYSSANVYLHPTLAAGISSADSADFAASPDTASSYLPGEPGIGKFYAWKVARDCNGEPACLEARVPARWATACAPKIAPDAPVRIAFRQYVEPATKVGPADAEMLYDRVIVFRPK
ncbi:MAG TPA: hypothetical protein VN428_13955 [Bryobacteraceae bacterium]|nr:hypothetical protein [Bryobacteraceae bacterium]